jgi:hypothetical protein
MNIKRKIKHLETGIKALELMQNDENFDNWIFLQNRIEELEYHLKWLYSLKVKNRERIYRFKIEKTPSKNCYY